MRVFTLWLALLVATELGSRDPAAAKGGHDLSPAVVSRRVAAVYGVSKPHVVEVQTTETDSTPHQRMYFVVLSGRFHRHGKQAHFLYFSALAARWYVWGIQGYDAGHHLVWVDPTLPTRHPAPRLS